MLTKTTTFFFLKTALVFLLYSTYSNAQTTVTLNATKDNTLYETATLSNGAGAYLFTGRTNQAPGVSKRRALLQFDIASTVPSGATITSVTLTMNNSKTISGANNVKLHKVTRAWGESTSNASGNEGSGTSAATGDATWSEAVKGTTNWTTAGGDFNGTASATTAVAATGSYTWSSPQMAIDVQNWLDNSATDFGWIIIGDENAGGSAKRFDSRENPISANRPKLEVTYTLPLSTAKVAKEEMTLKVYPNPAQKQVTIDRGTTNEATLELYDQQGRLLKQQNTMDALIEWNLESVNAGMYILKVIETDKIYRHKLLVQP